MIEQHEWWQSGIIYQIYPRSFMDSNGDGVGDLRGVMARLDYLQWLGVDCIWLSPIYPSPMADFGYDVADYCNIHPLFGNLADFDALLAETHKRGMKLVLDFVPNHTSDEHPWFSESRSSRDNPKRDWYLWKDPAPDGGPPNNWLSNFGGPAWTLDPQTGQYYFHAFLNKQPDVNWRHPELHEAMHNVLRFWLDRGVDGFRVDVIYHIVKDDQYRDNPRNPSFQSGQNPHHEFVATYTADRPEVHDIIAGMRTVVDEYDDRMLVGEIYLPVERLVAYYGDGGSGVHMPFNFQLISMPWDAHQIAHAIEHYEASLPDYGWPNWVLGNHDNARVASRVGAAQARVAAMMLLTLRGTPTMYYGDELGMHDVAIPRDRVQDPFEKNVPGMKLGRDPERTPMQWDASPNAGFTDDRTMPWLPIADDVQQVNVVTEQDDVTSMLSLYRKLITLRKKQPALSVGAFKMLGEKDDVIAYLRTDNRRKYLIALNFGPDVKRYALPQKIRGEVRASTLLDREGQQVEGQHIELRGDEGVVIEVSDDPL